MVTIFAFSAVVVLAVLLSGLSQRSVLSSAVLFLVAGFVLGPGVLGWMPIAPDDELLPRFAELALFSVLFTDGVRLGGSQMLHAWALPGRALVLGLPVTVVLVALLARWVADLPWADAWLLGAALSPTDPVFASALVGNEAVPQRLRHLLNAESGLNDGLALPIVIGMLAVQGGGAEEVWRSAGDSLLGAALGVAIAWLAVTAVRRVSIFEVSDEYAPLGALAIALMTFAASSILHANEFLAAFAAGVALSRRAPRAMEAFHPVGQPISEMLKLAALLLFGALLTPTLFTALTVRDYIFAVLTLALARPIAIVLAMARAHLNREKKLIAGWFGPKGFASVFFGFLILHAGAGNAAGVFSRLALVVAMSIVAHSSTDVLVARRFQQQ
jgi:sodium/hydrogen antiporter